MDVCLRVLKESNKSRFDSYSVRNKCIDHIPYHLSACRVHSFCDNLSRNSCISSRFFENQPNEICSHFSVKASKGWFLNPEKFQNHSNEGKGDQKNKERGEEKKAEWLQS